MFISKPFFKNIIIEKTVLWTSLEVEDLWKIFAQNKAYFEQLHWSEPRQLTVSLRAGQQCLWR